MSITYLDSSRVARVHVTDEPTYNRTVTGYGGKLPTPYMLTLDDRRKRRVYAMCYGNAASLYVIVAGSNVFLDVGTESMIEYAREYGPRDPVTFDASDAGCLIDGHHGWHAHAMLIDLAVSAGMPLDYGDSLALDSYRASDNNPTAVVLDHVLGTGGLLDRAEAWLNNYAAPKGHIFEWYDGEFYLTPDDEVWVN